MLQYDIADMVPRKVVINLRIGHRPINDSIFVDCHSRRSAKIVWSSRCKVVQSSNVVYRSFKYQKTLTSKDKMRRQKGLLQQSWLVKLLGYFQLWSAISGDAGAAPKHSLTVFVRLGGIIMANILVSLMITI